MSPQTLQTICIVLTSILVMGPIVGNLAIKIALWTNHPDAAKWLQRQVPMAIHIAEDLLTVAQSRKIEITEPGKTTKIEETTTVPLAKPAEPPPIFPPIVADATPIDPKATVEAVPAPVDLKESTPGLFTTPHIGSKPPRGTPPTAA